jgi:prepilin-type N-terminal cleavage/methylation domain-containing protein
MILRRNGFTLIELLLVMFIMVLLTLITIPIFYQFVKTSKVQQTASIVSTTLFRARMEAQRTRKMIGVFFGDEIAFCKTQPTPGVLPPSGRIEIWTVMDNYANGDFGDSAGSGAECSPYNNQGNWYPYRYPDRCLTPEPITYPTGVRILAGLFDHNGGYHFGWQNNWGQYQANGDGEIKRHTVTFSRTGAMPGWYNGLNSWWDIIVFDEQTGEHVVISVGEWLMSSKPRILPFQLTGMWGPSGSYYPITKTQDIVTYCEQ